jgi:hypothetical protein
MARKEDVVPTIPTGRGNPSTQPLFIALFLIPWVLSCAGHARSEIQSTQPHSEGPAVQDLAKNPEPIEVGRDLEHRLLLDGSGRFVNLVLPDSSYRRLGSNAIELEQAYFVTRLVYRHFQDAFDFVIFTFDRPPSIEGQRVYWRAFPARPAAQGLNLRFRDTTADAGSEGRLGSVILLRSPSDLISGPSLHEIMHNWGQRILPTDYESHWGRSSVNGALGGWKPGTLSLTEGGYYTTPGSRPGGPLMGFREGGGNSVPYADLELYMMGLLPPDSVGPVHVALGADYVPGQGSAFTASGFETYGIDRIVSEHGPRIPAYPEAPNTFRAILVVISSTPLGTREWRITSEHVRRFTMLADDGDDGQFNFWEATGGRGELHMADLAEELKNRGTPPVRRP